MTLLGGFGFNQRYWPGALADGLVNDCWVTAALRAIHAVAAWFRLVGVVAFRDAAGNASGAGTIANIVKGIAVLYPKLSPLIESHTAASGYTWSAFITKLKAGHVAVLFLNSGKLPSTHRFGYDKSSPLNHAVTVAWEGSAIQFANPLAKPHAKAIKVTEAALKAAAIDNAWHGVSCVFMPTEAAAFKTHPLYKDPTSATEQQLAAARATGFATGKAKATAAVTSIEL